MRSIHEPPQALLDALVAESRLCLGDALVGVYLHGSAAMGCYHPAHSDLDLLVVVHQEPTATAKRQYLDEIVRLCAAAPAKGIEMSVVDEAICRHFRYPTPYLLHFSKMHLQAYRDDPSSYIRRMRGDDPDLAAHFTVVLQRGRVLYGKPIREVFAPVDPRFYWDSIWQDVRNAPADILEQPLYMTLNLCRVLAWRKERQVLSKAEGGSWGIDHLPASFRPLLQAALANYSGAENIRYDPELLQSFAAWAIGQLSFSEPPAGSRPYQ